MTVEGYIGVCFFLKIGILVDAADGRRLTTGGVEVSEECGDF
jgi:hypothetical protein